MKIYIVTKNEAFSYVKARTKEYNVHFSLFVKDLSNKTLTILNWD